MNDGWLEDRIEIDLTQLDGGFVPLNFSLSHRNNGLVCSLIFEFLHQAIDSQRGYQGIG
jgi:hypothetical protein